jgi:hypothetical protein
MALEPDAAGAGAFSSSSVRGGKSGKANVVKPGNASFAFEFPGLDESTKKFHALSQAIQGFKQTVQSVSSGFAGGGMVNMLSQISRTAQVATQNLQGLSGAARGVGGGGGGGGRVGMAGGGGGGGWGGFAPSTSSNAAFATNLSRSAGASNNASVGGSTMADMGSSIGGAMGGAVRGITDSIGSIPILGGVAKGILDLAGDTAMAPLRFMRERIQTNRVSSLAMSQELTPYQWQGGGNAGIGSIMGALKNIPGNMKGDVNDILSAMTSGRLSGAMASLGGNPGQARADQFYNMVGQFQQITPGLGAGKVANIVGSQLQNTRGNQAAAFYTGGSFSLLKTGGGMKSASEWAQGIYNWLKNQRPGKFRGQNFEYGDLLAQNFPGSNINAWFDTAGVSPEMRDYWWSWALAQAGTGQTDIFADMDKKLGSNQAWRKASAATALTRNEFGLAGKMQGQYATRERSNQWFNQTMGAAVNRLVPAMAKGPLGFMQYAPDEVENFLWNMMESAGPLGQIIGGGIGWGSVAGATATMAAGSSGAAGDIGDYGSFGGTSTAGLNPDVRKKVEAMMRANPRLKVTSGLRDGYTQAKLQKKGIGHFGSGSPFIGDIGSIGVNGHSQHSAGWAADLGPRSEYGWIAKNAHKFGLETGGRHGEPWHVQNAGTVGGFVRPNRRKGMGDIGDTGPDVGGWWSGIPLVGAAGDAIAGIWDAATGAWDGIKMIGKMLGGLFNAFDKVKSMVGTDSQGTPGILNMSGLGPNSVATKSTQYMSMMFGDELSQILAKGGGDDSFTTQYDTAFAAGLPSDINLSNSFSGTGGRTGVGYTSPTMGGGMPGAGGAGSVSPASVQRILQKYAGGKTNVTGKAVDAATKQRMGVALQAAMSAGFSGDELVTIVSLAGRESNFRPEAYNGNLGTGDNSYGLWQINTLNGMWENMKGPLGLTSKDQLKDPMVNAKAARYLFDQSKQPFFAWGPYRGDAPLHGGAEDWVPTVYSVAKEAGYVGDLGDYGYSGGGGGGGRNITLHFNNNFNIPTQGTNGLDVSRVVPILADRLEEEMNKRLVRNR